MSQRTAKIIRKSVYGDLSLRTRTYKNIGRTVVCTGKRAEYLKAKRDYKK